MSDVVDISRSGTAALLEAVVEIWQRVLQRTPVLPDDNFFDLGGDSLLAIQLFAELERVTGRKLPITAIYDAGTPAELAAVLGDNADRPAFSPLVLLSDGDHRETPAHAAPASAPIFLVHGIGGNVMELSRLGRSIDPARRVYAIQARGLDGIESAIESIEEMADYYLDAVRREQPEGPYLLVGYSFGGMVALEMARRLEVAGEAVGLLGFIDSYPHPRYWPLVLWLDVRWRRIEYTARTQLRSRLTARLARLLGRDPGRGRRRGPNALARPFMFDEDWPEAVRRVYDTSLGALARYRPAGYAGSVVFFRATLRSFYLPNDPPRMWADLLRGFEVVSVPGNHVEMVGQNADALGAAIAERVASGLARVQNHVPA